MTEESDVLRSFVAQAQYLEGDLRPVDRNAVGVAHRRMLKFLLTQQDGAMLAKRELERAEKSLTLIRQYC